MGQAKGSCLGKKGYNGYAPNSLCCKYTYKYLHKKGALEFPPGLDKKQPYPKFLRDFVYKFLRSLLEDSIAVLMSFATAFLGWLLRKYNLIAFSMFMHST